MHLHGNANTGCMENAGCNAAMQISPDGMGSIPASEYLNRAPAYRVSSADYST